MEKKNFDTKNKLADGKIKCESNSEIIIDFKKVLKDEPSNIKTYQYKKTHSILSLISK